MSNIEERTLIYTALVLLCVIASGFMGLAAGAWTFVQMASVIELMYLFGGPESKETTSDPSI